MGLAHQTIKTQCINSTPLVLVVDDDPCVRLAVRLSLRDSHFEMTEACDARDALALLRSAPPPDVILSDWEMGGEGLDGPALLEARTGIPVVIMSGVKLGEAPLRLGASRFLPKPFSRAELIDSLDEALRPSAG